MCLASSAPRTPVPTALAPPPAPKKTDPAVRDAKSRARSAAALQRGRGGTVLGGEVTNKPANQPLKVLLGA